MATDGFIDIPFVRGNLDRYLVRTSIFNALQKVSPLLNGNLLDVGCGKMPYRKFLLDHSPVKDYTGLDLETSLVYEAGIKPDVTWNGIQIPLQDEAYDSAMATEVLEHCPEPEIVLKEIFRIIKPGGIFFFTVPFLWNLHEVPHDHYRYTPFSLERHLGKAGFKEVQIFSTGGWHASMAQMLGLWVRRSPISSLKRSILSTVLMPVIKYLVRKDINPGKDFKEGQMITGLYGWARK